MSLRLSKLFMALSMAALSLPAQATELRFDGFASFVAGQTANKKSGTDRDEFRGFDDTLGYQDNSIFALQARAALEDGLSATAQVAAKGSEQFQAKFNWAYLTYEINNEWSARFGRSRIPFFMYSDSLDVGYSYHWISPPNTVYGLGGFDSSDGVAIDYLTNLGDWVSRLTLITGRSQLDLNVAGEVVESEISELGLIAWSLNYDWWTMRFVYAKAQINIPLQQLPDAIEEFNDAGLAFSDDTVSKALIDFDPAAFAGVGFSIDREKFLIVGEYTQLKFEENILGNPSRQWYLSAGYRMEEFMPYVTYEEIETTVPDKYRNAFINEVPEPFQALATPYVDALFGTQISDATVYGIGVRYDFHPSAALKVEYQQQDDHLTDANPEVLAVAIDLVF